MTSDRERSKLTRAKCLRGIERGPLREPVHGHAPSPRERRGESTAGAQQGGGQKLTPQQDRRRYVAMPALDSGGQCSSLGGRERRIRAQSGERRVRSSEALRVPTRSEPPRRGVRHVTRRLV